MRASGSDEKARLIPPVQFSLEEALEYIKGDEYVEVTPKSMRMRKVILDETERKRANKNCFYFLVVIYKKECFAVKVEHSFFYCNGGF